MALESFYKWDKQKPTSSHPFLQPPTHTHFKKLFHADFMSRHRLVTLKSPTTNHNERSTCVSQYSGRRQAPASCYIKCLCKCLKYIHRPLHIIKSSTFSILAIENTSHRDDDSMAGGTQGYLAAF